MSDTNETLKIEDIENFGRSKKHQLSQLQLKIMFSTLQVL